MDFHICWNPQRTWGTEFLPKSRLHFSVSWCSVKLFFSAKIFSLVHDKSEFLYFTSKLLIVPCITSWATSGRGRGRGMIWCSKSSELELGIGFPSTCSVIKKISRIRDFMVFESNWCFLLSGAAIYISSVHSDALRCTYLQIVTCRLPSLATELIRSFGNGNRSKSISTPL